MSDFASRKNINMNYLATDYNYDKKTYTVREIAEILSLSTRTAYSFCKKTTDFRVLSLGRNIRIHKESFDEWFEGL